MDYVPLIYGLRDHERYVYHYTKARTALDYIIRYNTLRLSVFSKTNDPRESTTWRFNMGSLSRAGHPLLEKYGAADRVSKLMSGPLQKAARVACFCSDAPELTGEPTADIYLRGLAKPRMWAQYGQDHRGVCLVFDRNKLLKAMSAGFRALPNSIFLVWSPVAYSNHRLVPPLHEHEFSVTAEDLAEHGLEQYPWAHLRRYWRRLFFEKAIDWSGETEWRIVGFTKSKGPLDLPIGDSLAAVIHGARISVKTSKAIISLTDRPEVEHMGLTWMNGAPWYDIGGTKGHWRYNDRRLFERIDARLAAAAKT